MGIPGLTGSVRHARQRYSRDAFEGGFFLIDGYNLALCRCKDPIGNLNGTEALKVRLADQLTQLLKLKPPKVGFYVDAYVPKGKREAIERRERELGSKSFQSFRGLGELILGVVQDKLPEIEVVLTGMEAEDVMMRDTQDCLQLRSSAKKRNTTTQIYAIPSSEGWLDSRVIAGYRLSGLAALSAVRPHSQTIKPLSGNTVRNPKRLCFQSLCFENSLLAGYAYVLQSLIPCIEGVAPFKAGAKYRHAAFSYMMNKKNFEGDIEEYAQDGLAYRSQILKRLPLSEVKAVQESLETDKPAAVIRKCLKTVAPKSNTDAAMSYIDALLKKEKISKGYSSAKATDTIAVYLMAICISLVFAAEVFETDANEFRDLLLRSSPRSCTPTRTAPTSLPID